MKAYQVFNLLDMNSLKLLVKFLAENLAACSAITEALYLSGLKLSSVLTKLLTVCLSKNSPVLPEDVWF